MHAALISEAGLRTRQSTGQVMSQNEIKSLRSYGGQITSQRLMQIMIRTALRRKSGR